MLEKGSRVTSVAKATKKEFQPFLSAISVFSVAKIFFLRKCSTWNILPAGIEILAFRRIPLAAQTQVL